MSFLDRFKTQPKYRNPDPAIRLAGIAELPDDAESWGVIGELAASDEDVRVRRAAIDRIGAVGYLARIARTERDEALRREVGDRLVAIANQAAETDADAAVAACVRVREKIEPNEEWMRAYEDGYARFRALYPAIRGVEEQE